MIIGKFLKGQGLGNQLWNYAALRSIAEHHGQDFYFYGGDQFKANDFLKFPMTSLVGYDFPKDKSPVIEDVFHEAIFYDSELNYYSSGFDASVNYLSGNVYCQGLFQSEKYFFDNNARIKKYFDLDKAVINNNSVSSNVCVINLRGGEYKRHKDFILPMSYWMNAIAEMNRRHEGLEYIVVTDDFRYAKSMFPKLKVVYGSIANCYATIYNSRYVICSNSTFSYFPIKTSRLVKTVIAPKYWARFNDSSNRWASPANLYSNWLWADRNGEISSSEDCLDECATLEHEYITTYTVRVPPNSLEPFSFRRFIPESMKFKIKKILSLLLPKHFG